jgi:starch phosphorylase
MEFNKEKLSNVRIPKTERRIAYFSMEIGIHPKIPTYSGGLGVLAGDTVKSCADLNVPLVVVSLLYKKGYFYQKLDERGSQQELPYEWNPKQFLTLLKKKVTVTIENRTVFIQAWQYDVLGVGGYRAPVIFLDTDIDQNNEYDRSLTHFLYGGDQRYRFAQEIVLGIGGVRMLKELGYHHISRYHMNEGHASLLTLELLNQRKREQEPIWDIDGVRRMCVFTTHTPVSAGHDQFSYDLVWQLLGEFIPIDFLKNVGGEDRLNMTLLALNLSHYVNGVAKKHGKISREMFPGYHIDSITNGIHSPTWVSENFKKLYDEYIPGWLNDPFTLRYALSIPKDEIWNAHQQVKRILIDYVNAKINAGMDYDTLTIGFARRATAYKRADLVFFDVNRLINIAHNVGKIQFIFSGKAHPQDWPGKELIKRIISTSSQLKDNIKIVYLENYDMELAKMLISGVDLWLNTPRKPKEASGTSGMKAAHNGVPSLSILDGWWIEGCIEGLTGWSIGSALDVENVDETDAYSLYEKLEKIIIPTFYNNRQSWIDIMRHCIAINASFFNTHRMVQQYVLNAYLY